MEKGLPGHRCRKRHRRRIAERFATDGAKVVVANLDLDAAQQAADTLGRTGSGTAMAVEMDVTSAGRVGDSVARVARDRGGVDVLVSNAGIRIVPPSQEFAFPDWKKLPSTHLDGAFLTSRAVLPHVYEKGAGSIIFMGSIRSTEASALKSAYVTTKHGPMGLSKVIAQKGGPKGVRSNVICPCFVRTPLPDKQIPEQARDLATPAGVIDRFMLGGTVDKTFTTVDDAAQIAWLFAVFLTNALTGQGLNVSHGRSMTRHPATGAVSVSARKDRPLWNPSR